MKGLVLFRSHYGNTRVIAEAIGRQITASNHEAVVHDMRQKLPDLRGFDFFLIGAPTRMARVTGKAISVLKRLQRTGQTGKPVAVFDTYGPLPASPEELERNKKWFFPGAAGIMQKVARDLGLNVYPEALRCDVASYKGPLTEGQVRKAEAFSRQFLSSIFKER